MIASRLLVDNDCKEGVIVIEEEEEEEEEED